MTQNISISGCITLGIREEPDEEGECARGHQVLVNTSSHFTKGLSVSIPFPEPGLWYLTLKPWCYLLNARCVLYVDCLFSNGEFLMRLSLEQHPPTLPLFFLFILLLTSLLLSILVFLSLFAHRGDFVWVCIIFFFCDALS